MLTPCAQSALPLTRSPLALQAAVPDAATAAATPTAPEAGALLQDLPFEVAALFAVIFAVGVGGLVKQSGVIDKLGEASAAAASASAGEGPPVWPALFSF